MDFGEDETIVVRIPRGRMSLMRTDVYPNGNIRI